VDDDEGLRRAGEGNVERAQAIDPVGGGDDARRLDQHDPVELEALA
jgi:hypothetical protein